MLLSLTYLVIRMLLKLLVRDGHGAKDLETVVLRRELTVPISPEVGLLRSVSTGCRFVTTPR